MKGLTVWNCVIGTISILKGIWFILNVSVSCMVTFWEFAVLEWVFFPFYNVSDIYFILYNGSDFFCVHQTNSYRILIDLRIAWAKATHFVFPCMPFLGVSCVLKWNIFVTCVYFGTKRANRNKKTRGRQRKKMKV